MQNKVSIVVPVYNVGKYLPKCINSLIDQSWEFIEIILVDDGSTDNSPEICDEYAKKDNRIKVIHKENGGLSDARNVGIAAATGEYILFVDSDDWFESEMVESYYKMAVMYDCDVVIQGFIIDYILDNYSVQNVIEQMYKAQSVCEVSELVTLLEKKGLFNSACNKLYRKSIIVDYSIKFDLDGMPAEDLLFNCKFFKYVNNGCILNVAHYHYVKRDIDTITVKYEDGYHKKILKYYDARKELYSSLSISRKSMEFLLNNGLCGYAFTAISNIFRKNAPVSFDERNKILKYLFTNQCISTAINNADTSNLYIRLMKFFCRYKLPTYANLSFSVLFFLRHKFNFFYKKIRKRILYE